MNKIILIAGAILLIALVGFIALRPSSGTGAVITSNAVKNIGQTEEQRYAMFEAEVACELMAAFGGEDIEDQKNFIQTTLQVIEEVSDKYGYTMSEVEANKAKYENDLKFQGLTRDYALDLCPEIASELGMDN